MLIFRHKTYLPQSLLSEIRDLDLKNKDYKAYGKTKNKRNKKGTTAKRRNNQLNNSHITQMLRLSDKKLKIND